MDTRVRNGYSALLVNKKLPDDLQVAEFARISTAVSDLCAGAVWLRDGGPVRQREYDALPIEIDSVRYGSPLEIVVMVPAAIVGTVWVAVKAVRDLMKAVAQSAEIHHIEAQRDLVQANTRKTDAETELLRLEIFARRRALSSPDGQRMAEEALAKGVGEAGFVRAAHYISDADLMPLGGDRNHGAARRFVESAKTLSEYGLNPDLIDPPRAS